VNELSYGPGHSSALGRHPNKRKLNLYEQFVKHIRGCIASVSLVLPAVSLQRGAFFTRDRSGATSPREGERMLLIILIILLLVFGFGGYRLGPGMGYYGGGGISLIILIVIILLLLRVI
jgi:hypothetical protein